MISGCILKVKTWYKENKSDCYIAAVIFLVGLLSFGLGRLSVLWPQKEPITVVNQQSGIINQENHLKDDQGDISSSGSKSPIYDSNGKYVASKNGSAYHFPWCAGAQKIKEENKIWFDTKEAAEAAGYRPAANCEGL